MGKVWSKYTNASNLFCRQMKIRAIALLLFAAVVAVVIFTPQRCEAFSSIGFQSKKNWNFDHVKTRDETSQTSKLITLLYFQILTLETKLKNRAQFLKTRLDSTWLYTFSSLKMKSVHFSLRQWFSFEIRTSWLKN